MTTIVFWLLIATGRTDTPPVYLPAPFASEEDCSLAGEAFKASPMDYFERGDFTCIPQTVEAK